MCRWRGGRLLQYLPSLRHDTWGTSNNRKWTMPGTPKSYENTFMNNKKICVLLCFQSFLWAKQFFLTKVIFIQGAFKSIQGLFKDIPQFFNFQVMLFQGPCEPWDMRVNLLFQPLKLFILLLRSCSLLIIIIIITISHLTYQ